MGASINDFCSVSKKGSLISSSLFSLKIKKLGVG